MALTAGAATIQWYTQQPTVVPNDTMTLAVERVTPHAYGSFRLASLRDWVLQNVTVINTTTNYYVFSTNIWQNNSYVSNYVVTNVYNDTYASNFFTTNNYVTNQYTTNVTVTNWIQNNSYITNFFNTNIYNNDSYVSNYFTTNLYTTTINTNYYAIDTRNLYVSNLFATNIVTYNEWVTYLYTTNISVTDGITNYSLTPNTVLRADANKRISSIPNGSGVLTNNGSGTVGYFPLASLFANISNAFVTNLSGRDIYFSNAFFTNLVAGNAWVSNMWVTNLVAREAWISNLWVTNLIAQKAYISNLWVTNLVAEKAWISNLWVTNLVSEKAWISNLWVTNLVAEKAWISNLWATNIWVDTIHAKTNEVGRMILTNGMVIKEWAWEGPTNQLNVGSTNRYRYTAYTPCAVTNLVPWLDGFNNSSVLEIDNASSSNITVTIYAPVQIPVEDASRVYTLTNGNSMVCSVEAVPGIRSNSVLRAFKP